MKVTDDTVQAPDGGDGLGKKAAEALGDAAAEAGANVIINAAWEVAGVSARFTVEAACFAGNVAAEVAGAALDGL